MSPPTSDDAFAEVKAKVDLVKVVQEHLRLTKRNKELWGLCPFHQEDSPSFKVNPQMQTWYCFGCQRNGDVFTFVELIEKTDKRGALQMLAERAGVELKRLSPEQKERSDSRRRLLAMLKLAAQYYEYVLWSTPAGEVGRRLLADRDVSEETARRFQLGYAPAGLGFAEYLRSKKRSLADAQEAGLMRRDGTDFFAQRLVIPIRDERGQPLAFTARTVRADEPRKYINSPETPAYIKGRVIFGLDLARDEIARGSIQCRIAIGPNRPAKPWHRVPAGAGRSGRDRYLHRASHYRRDSWAWAGTTRNRRVDCPRPPPRRNG